MLINKFHSLYFLSETMDKFSLFTNNSQSLSLILIQFPIFLPQSGRYSIKLSYLYDND